MLFVKNKTKAIQCLDGVLVPPASVEELKTADGMNITSARSVWNYFHPSGDSLDKSDTANADRMNGDNNEV